MFLDFYKLPEQPFGVTPDPRFLFLSDTHKEALASLLYGIEARRGFIVLMADPGLGKTTLLFHVLGLLQDQACTVFLLQVAANPPDLLRAILVDLGVTEISDNLVEMQLKLNDILVEQARAGRRFVVIVDEAQALRDSVLELLRLLSNFETPREKLIQIIMCGQPSLGDRLSSPGLVQLRQRVSIRARLRALTPEETVQYIRFRLTTAGYTFDVPLFTPDALRLIAQFSEGIPRNINNLCFNALSLGCARKEKTIDVATLHEVAADLDFSASPGDAAAPMHSDQTGPVDNLLPDAAADGLPAARRVPKLVVVAIILLAISGTLCAGAWRIERHMTTRTIEASSSPASSANARFDKTAAQPTIEVFPLRRQGAPTIVHKPQLLVRVDQGQTLLGICAKQYGNCDPLLLRWIHVLNPQLRSFTHIMPGQELRLPVLGTVQNATLQKRKPTN